MVVVAAYRDISMYNSNIVKQNTIKGHYNYIVWHNVLPSNHGWKFEKMIKIGTAETREVRDKSPLHPPPHTLFELRVG